MKQNFTRRMIVCLMVLIYHLSIFAANRYWVHKPFYENSFASTAELADWNLVEDNGTGNWELNGDGTAVLTMDDEDGAFANRLFNTDGASPRLLPLDVVHGRVELMVIAITGGDQRIFIQVEQFDENNAYLGQQDLLTPQSATGFFSINLSGFSWHPEADKVRFIVGGENHSSEQGTITLDYFSYSNENGSWGNTANWSSNSGGPGGASIPGAADIAILDGGNGDNGSCSLTADRNVGGIEITSNYSGNFDLEGFDLSIGGMGVLIEGGGITGNGANITIDGDVNIGGGAFTNFSGINDVSGDITISGGIHDFTSGEVRFSGGSDQEFLSTLTNPINQLTIDKPQGKVILNSDILIANLLSLSEGIIETGGNIVRVGISDNSMGQVVLGSGRIDGALSRWVSSNSTAALLYPLGNAMTYAPVTLEVNAVPGTGGTCTVSYNDVEPPAFNPVNFMDGPDVIGNRSAANWETQTSGLNGGTYSLFAANDHLGSIDDLSELHLTLSTSVVGTHEDATGTLSNPILGRIELTAANLNNTWYASLESAMLPLSWGSFTAIPQKREVHLRWSTLQEDNTSHFAIEHAVDGISFVDIGTLDAAGQQYGVSEYGYEHDDPAIGVNYYRLRQIDLDGSYTYSVVTSADIESDTEELITHLTNPIIDELSLKVPFQEVDFQVVDLKGKILLRGNLDLGDHRFDSSSWSPGIYQVSISADDKMQIYKVIKL